MIRTWLKVAWILVAMLVLTAGLQYLGNRDTSVIPSIDIAKPGGASAFAQLLRDSGYEVRRDTRPFPKVASDELLVMFEIRKQTRKPTFRRTVAPRLKQWVQDGGRLLVLSVSEDLTPDTLQATASQTVRFWSGDQAQLPFYMMWPRADSFYLGWAQIETPVSRLGGEDTTTDDCSTVSTIGQGRIVGMNSGDIALNRYLDSYDSASFLMAHVKLAAPGKKVVFTEIGFGGSTPEGLLRTIHPFLEGAWLQLLVLLLVIGYTLNIRFGYPSEPRFVQRGSRELLDGVAHTLQRSSMTQLVLDQTLRRAEAEVAKQGGKAKASPALQEVVAELTVASGQAKFPASQTFILVRKTHEEISQRSRAARKGGPKARSEVS